MTTREILNLKKEVGFNKKMPAKYEESILTALAFYPELKKIEIHFVLSDSHPVPYSTAPVLSCLFKAPLQRSYHVTLLEKAKEPVKAALFKNLSHECRVAVIAHELAHIVQFNSCGTVDLLKTLASYPLPAFKRKMEQGADLATIDHGLGPELYKFATYLREIPGYVQSKPEIERYYLKPEAILACMKV